MEWPETPQSYRGQRPWQQCPRVPRRVALSPSITTPPVFPTVAHHSRLTPFHVPTDFLPCASQNGIYFAVQLYIYKEKKKNLWINWKKELNLNLPSQLKYTPIFSVNVT